MVINGLIFKSGAWRALIWKKMAPKITWTSFFWESHFGVFFRAIWGNSDKNPSRPQKFAWSYTYCMLDYDNWLWSSCHCFSCRDSDFYATNNHQLQKKWHLQAWASERDFSGWATVDFSRWWQKKLFPGGATVMKFHFTNSNLRGKHFSTKTVTGK